MTTSAFAAYNLVSGEILVNTISSTERGAMVNWLVTEASTMVYHNWTDELIRRIMMKQACFRNATILAQRGEGTYCEGFAL